MASIEKYTHDAICNLLRHNERSIATNSNEDIDINRRDLNYSFEMDHGNLTNFEYYKKIRDEKYLYGRDSEREKNIITAAGWVVTCPKELLDSPEKQKLFFKGVYEFIGSRYGPENIIDNAVHYDEGGAPHIHVVFVPSTHIDHDMIHYKTKWTKYAVKTDSGRYEFTKNFVFDKNGEKIPVKNYAKMSDYYSEKISASDVINKAELQHFHQDLQTYLISNGIEGAVLNGATGGQNISVKSLKEFTKTTGLTLDEVKSLKKEKEIIKDTTETAEMAEELRSKEATISKLEKTIAEHSSTIEDLWKQIEEKSNEILREHSQVNELKDKVKELETLHEKDQAKIKELEASIEKQNSQEVQPAWGSKEWGKTATWGATKDITIDKGV